MPSASTRRRYASRPSFAASPPPPSRSGWSSSPRRSPRRCPSAGWCEGRSPPPRSPRRPAPRRPSARRSCRCRRRRSSRPCRRARSSPCRSAGRNRRSFGTLKRLAVENLVLEEDDRVRIADRGLQQTLGVGSRVRLDHLQARHLASTRRRSPGCAARRRARRRRSARGRRSGSPSGRPPCRASSPPS